MISIKNIIMQNSLNKLFKLYKNKININKYIYLLKKI